MSKASDSREAREACELLGQFMDFRYLRRTARPIQRWQIPAREKKFFTCFAMNVVLEGDGFECLVSQHLEDVQAFIDILGAIGAKKTSKLVSDTVTALRNNAPCDENKHTSAYYSLVRRDRVWPKLVNHVGHGLFVRYFKKAQEIGEENIFNPKIWERVWK